MSSNSSLGRGVLTALVVANGGMFVVEIVAGIAAESMGLITDGLDMGADAAVYLLALAAVGAAAGRKLSAARFAGRVQLVLALLAFAEVIRRAVMGSEPESRTMILISLVALAANVFAITLLRKHRDGEVHLRAAWIFSWPSPGARSPTS
jgi:Co/Zn/Cd efflux system component